MKFWQFCYLLITFYLNLHNIFNEEVTGVLKSYISCTVFVKFILTLYFLTVLKVDYYLKFQVLCIQTNPSVMVES